MRESSTPEHNAWGAMIQRCRNPKHPKYESYGGRGIEVCERWLAYSNFLADMGRKPTSKHSLDREKNHLGYFPANCRWADIKTQQNNTRMNKYHTIEGVTNTIAGWTHSCGIRPNTVYNRIHVLNWDLTKALTHPAQRKYRNFLAKV